MNIIKEKWLFLNATLVHAPKQIRKLYQFGLQTISAEHVVSLRSNARLAGLRWATAKSKMWRLTKNRKFVSVFEHMIPVLAPVSENDIVAVDFSDFGNGFQVLTFAKQTKRGRALPLSFEILRYPIPKDSQNLLVNAAVIIDRYYHRFEIEEFFRDAKRLLGLEQVSWQTETSLKVTLWFVILGIWCLKHIADGMDELAKQSREKMQLSETRYLFEALRTEIFCASEAKYLHSYDV